MASLIYQVDVTPGVRNVSLLEAAALDRTVAPSSISTTGLHIVGERERIQLDDVGAVPAHEESGGKARPEANEPVELEQHDPWQEFNGKTFAFNRRLDKQALRPIAKQWKALVPERAQIMIANAFDNVTVVPRIVNNLLQGKWEGAEREMRRFLVNSTAGVGGLFDPATDVWHITRSPADFGQTLGKWGAAPGPYVILPFTEPLTVRDGIGKIVDRAMDPLTYVVPVIPALGLTVAKRINERALDYELFVDLDDSVIDAYTAARDAYWQRRKHMLDQ